MGKNKLRYAGNRRNERKKTRRSRNQPRIASIFGGHVPFWSGYSLLAPRPYHRLQVLRAKQNGASTRREAPSRYVKPGVRSVTLAILCVSRSRPRNPVYTKPSSFSRKRFAKVVERVCTEIGARAEGIAVFQEKRRNNQIHFHSMVHLDRKPQRVHQVRNVFRSSP